MIRKHSLTLQGHQTSVSLEDEFWAELQRMAARLGCSIRVLAENIDRARGDTNLSSALRLAVLADLQAAHSRVSAP